MEDTRVLVRSVRKERRGTPASLRPAKGVLVGAILGIAVWSFIACLTAYFIWLRLQHFH